MRSHKGVAARVGASGMGASDGVVTGRSSSSGGLVDLTDREIDLSFRDTRQPPTAQAASGLMTALIRSAVLTSFTEVASSCGLNAHALLADTGLPQRCLDEPDLKVPARAVARLLELAAQRGHEPAFGLRLAESR